MARIADPELSARRVFRSARLDTKLPSRAVDSFDLAGRAMIVDRARASSGASDAHYGVPSVDITREMPVLKALAPVQQLAVVALLALYNGKEAQAVLKGKRQVTMNPPAVAAFAALRDEASEDPTHTCFG